MVFSTASRFGDWHWKNWHRTSHFFRHFWFRCCRHTWGQSRTSSKHIFTFLFWKLQTQLFHAELLCDCSSFACFTKRWIVLISKQFMHLVFSGFFPRLSAFPSMRADASGCMLLVQESLFRYEPEKLRALLNVHLISVRDNYYAFYYFYACNFCANGNKFIPKFVSKVRRIVHTSFPVEDGCLVCWKVDVEVGLSLLALSHLLLDSPQQILSRGRWGSEPHPLPGRTCHDLPFADAYNWPPLTRSTCTVGAPNLGRHVANVQQGRLR